MMPSTAWPSPSSFPRAAKRPPAASSRAGGSAANELAEHLPHATGQMLYGIRLGEEFDPGLQNPPIDDEALRVSRYEQDTKVGQEIGGPLGQHTPVHARHDDVGDEELGHWAKRRQGLQSVTAARKRVDVVTEA